MPTRLRPSAALIIAGLSLFVAIGGTAYATAKISGKQIVNHSISGKKLITNTLGGTQINESRLGTVPRAHAAGKADQLGKQLVRSLAGQAVLGERDRGGRVRHADE